MTDFTLSDETRDLLMQVSTASVATALYKRGLRNQFIQGVSPVNWKGRNMVGQAFTLRYIPAREDRNPIEVFRNAGHPQRVAVETCPPGHVLVMDSRKDPRAASAGSILVTRLAMRGCAGIVSDGGFRDAEGIGKLDMPAYHKRPSAPTNLTLHEALDINVPISCGDAAVFPGDVLVGDGDGVMVIPAHLADEIAKECTGMETFEDFVLEQVKDGAAIIGLYPPTSDKAQSDYAAWRKKTGR
ncbi:ribonuclease activity regulator RraA [Mesorhizobium sp. BE184]|uniref:ribonuclease activity regulator RraA n=1 Tax=Mesorhizobium sp. BE184 TaxID=2817714 RepID=UPI0028571838|nr:ribonuclease activity regulator RraA [Mesorhizobium sp. BE184]MDR7032303.1 regulator of RNase E activity RraA [Mesorhizobium sp. BE184]